MRFVRSCSGSVGIIFITFHSSEKTKIVGIHEFSATSDTTRSRWYTFLVCDVYIEKILLKKFTSFV